MFAFSHLTPGKFYILFSCTRRKRGEIEKTFEKSGVRYAVQYGHSFSTGSAGNNDRWEEG